MSPTDTISQAPKIPELSVFFPCYNEVGNLRGLVDRALEIFPVVADRFEIILVDDGSTDGTGPLADELAGLHPEVRVIHHPANQGYGAALRSGFAAAQYDPIFFTDGDGQFDPAEIKTLIPLLEEADLVAGYRIRRRDRWHRTINARAYNLFIRILFGLRHRDIDCAFKLIRRKVLDAIELKSDGALISAELLIKARRAGFIIKQAGVHHYPRTAGTQTGADLSVILKMFREVLRFRKELQI